MFRVERFNSDQQALAAAGLDEPQELFIMGGIDAGLAYPADLQRNERAEKFLGLLHVGGDVVIHEKYQGLFDAAYLVNDFFHRAARLGIGKIRLDGAELATKMAAASGFHQSYGQIALAGKDRTVRPKSDQRRPLGLAIHTAQ